MVSITHQLYVLIEHLGVEHRHVMYVGTLDLLGATIIVIVRGAYKNLDCIDFRSPIFLLQLQFWDLLLEFWELGGGP